MRGSVPQEEGNVQGVSLRKEACQNVCVLFELSWRLSWHSKNCCIVSKEVKISAFRCIMTNKNMINICYQMSINTSSGLETSIFSVKSVGYVLSKKVYKK